LTTCLVRDASKFDELNSNIDQISFDLHSGRTKIGSGLRTVLGIGPG